MHRIILIVLILYINSAYAQQSFDKELLLIESKIYTSSSDTIGTNYCLQKLDLYIKNETYSTEALTTAKRIDYDKISDSGEQVRFLWNAALLAHFNNDKVYAPHYINTYRQLSKDTSIKANLLLLVINHGVDTALVSKSLKELKSYSNEFDSLRCVNSMYDYSIEHKKRYTVASELVPGLGSMLTGHVTKGLTSLVLTGGSAYAVYALVASNLYVSALVGAYAVGARFYFGNIALTKKLVLEKEELKKNTLATDCKCILNKALDKYPLYFK